MEQEFAVKVYKSEDTNAHSLFRVVVEGPGVQTEHMVRLEDAYRTTLVPESVPQEEFIEWTFHFLLERESPAEILKEFSVSEVKIYFPEYENEVRTHFADR